MPIIPKYVSGFPWADPIFRSIQGFTYQDGTTFLEILRSLDNYVKTLADVVNATLEGSNTQLEAQIAALVQTVNDSLAAQVDQVDAQLAAQNANVAGQLAAQALDIANQLAAQNIEVTNILAAQTAEVATILEALRNESIDFSDPVLVAIITNINTASRAVFDALYSARRVHVVVGMGQSNMSGRGMNNDNPGADGTSANIYQFGWKNKSLRLATDPLDMIDTPDGMGPLLQFARHLKSVVGTNDIIVVIPAAEGGRLLTSSSVNSWKFDYPNGLSSKTLTQIQLALDAIDNQWPHVKVSFAAYLWHQGESDAGSGVDSSTYRSELIKLINGFRAAFGGSSTPFIIGQLVRGGIDRDNGKRIISYAHTTMPYYYSKLGFAVGNYDENGDNHHYSQKGQQKLAKSYFDEYLRVIGGLRPTHPIQAFDGGYYVADAFSNSGSLSRTAANLGWLITGQQGSVAPPADLLRVVSGGVEPVDTVNGPGQFVYMTMNPHNRDWPEDATIDIRQTIEFNVAALRSRTARIVFCFRDYNNYMAIELNAPATGGGATNYGLSQYIEGVRTVKYGDLSVLSADNIVVNVGKTSVRAFVDGRREIGFGGAITIPDSLVGNSRVGYRFDPACTDRLGALYVKKYQGRDS